MQCPKPESSANHQTWSRTDNICANENNNSQEDLDMRRKSEILQYKNNSTRLTKRENYAKMAKGRGCKTTFASQSYTAGTTNNNVKKLTRNGNTLILLDATPSVISTHSSASDVPGNTMLRLDMSIPLTRYRVRRTY